MIIDKNMFDLFESNHTILQRAANQTILLLENDDGLIAFDDNGDGEDGVWYVDQQGADQQGADQPDENDIIATQISQTQDVFTKMYLMKRLEKLKKYIKNLIDLMEMKYDIDEFEQLKRIQLYLNILDDIGLILPSDTLYHMISGFEFDLMDIIDKIDKIVHIQPYEIPEENANE